MKLRPKERLDLLSRISTTLQERYNTTQINLYLSRYEVPVQDVGIVPSKRVYVLDLLKTERDELLIEIGRDLGLSQDVAFGPSVSAFNGLLENQGYEHVKEDFARALATCDTAPRDAITAASSLLESVCKAVLDHFKLEYPKDESIEPLTTQTFKVLKLSPDEHADPVIKGILGGLRNITVNIGRLRTGYGSAHGKGERNARIEPRHARLAVNAASSVALFILETVHERHKDQHVLTEVTKRNIIAYILKNIQPFHGRFDLLKFLRELYPVDSMTAFDRRFSNLADDIRQHWINNYDYEDEYLLIEYFELLTATDEAFLKFVCLVLDPRVQNREDMQGIVEALSSMLEKDGYTLKIDRLVSGKTAYRVNRVRI